MAKNLKPNPIADALKLLSDNKVQEAGDVLAHALEAGEASGAMSEMQAAIACMKSGDMAGAKGHMQKAMELMGEEDENSEDETQSEPATEAVSANPSDYLYVPDAKTPSTWKLPIVENGTVTVAQLGRAAAALGPGFRGQPVDMPPDAKKACAKKLIALYKEQKAEPPEYLYGIAGETKPVKESVQIHESATARPVRALEGKEWEVVLIQAGLSKNGNYYPADVLKPAVQMFEGVKSYDSHVTDDELKKNPARKVGELLGWFDKVRWDNEKQSIVGHFHAAAQWLREMMLNAWNDGKSDLVGFSIDAFVNSDKRQMEGKEVNHVTGFERVNSVDTVCEPAAGGGVVRVLASMDAQAAQANSGDAPIKQNHPAVAGGGNKKMIHMTKDELIKALKEASDEDRLAIAEALKVEVPADAEKVEENKEDESEPETETAKVDEALNKRLYNLELSMAVKESGLPRDAQDLVLDTFKDKVGTPIESVQRFVEAQRKLLNSTVSAAVKGAGQTLITAAGPVFDVTAGERSLMRMLGLATAEDTAALQKSHIGRMTLREWYNAYTGDEEFLGLVAPHRVTEAAITTTTFNSVVKNALNKLIDKRISSWESKMWWRPIVAELDQETIQDITVVKRASVGTLSSLAEGEAYTELSTSDSEETASFQKYGNYLGITIETFMKDNLNALRDLPNDLVEAWYYSMSDLVSATFTDASGAGPTLTETSRALYNTTEANYGTTALSYASFVAARSAMRKLTQLGSSRRLGTTPKYLLVPVDLEPVAIQIRESEKDPDNAENGVNIVKGKFEIIPVVSWTDATNWYLLADPNDIETIQLHYFRGRRKPELFTADDQTQGSLFTNDTIRYKIRFFCAKVISNWRGSYGSVCAG